MLPRSPHKALLWLTALGLLAACGRDARPDATIAVATNIQPVIETLETRFEDETGWSLAIATGSTGKLYAQITNGAPFDIFLAADAERPARLEADGQAVPGARFTYAIGRIVLWDPKGTPVTPDRLAAGDLRTLAMANPDLAPYGKAAAETLDWLGLGGEPAAKVALGENVGQAFAFAQTGNAELGFVALAQVIALPEDKRGAHWMPPADAHAPIRQDAVLLARGADNRAALAFFDYLQREEVHAFIASQGYDIP